jgi:hypothetical protein
MLFSNSKLHAETDRRAPTFPQNVAGHEVVSDIAPAIPSLPSPAAMRSTCRGPLPEQDGQEYSQAQREKPQRGCRRSYRADPAQFAGRNSWIEDEPAGVATL